MKWNFSFLKRHYHLLLLSSFSFFIGFSTSAQTFPSSTLSCPSGDLSVDGAYVIGGDECNSCQNGTVLTRTLVMKINNKTGSIRTKFVLWGTYQRTSPTGQTTGAGTITACVGPIPASGTYTATAGTITYTCGELLQIVNVTLAWTDAATNNKNTCEYIFANPDKISPKCGRTPNIFINAGVNAQVASATAGCTTGGTFTITPVGGAAPTATYTVLVTNGGSYSETFTTVAGANTTTVPPIVVSNLPSGTYSITITDGSPYHCTQTLTRTIGFSGAVTQPIASVLTPTCASGTGTVTVTNYVSGQTYSLTTSGGPNYTAVSGVFTNVQGEKTYTLTASEGLCSSSTSVYVPESPGAPPAPALYTIQPTCSVITGTITLTADAALQYKLDNGGFGAYPSGGWSGLAAGVHTVTVRRITDYTCTSFSTATLTANQGAPTAPILYTVQPTCSVTTGTVTLTSDAALQYKLDNGDFGAYPSGGWSGLAAGVHTVTVRRITDYTCTSFSTATLTANQGAPTAPTLYTVQPTCSVITGTITLTSDAALQYKLDNGDFGAYPNEGWSGLAAGVHTVTVRRITDYTCTSFSTATLTANQGAPTAPTLYTVQPTCSVTTGTITLTSDAALQYKLDIGDFGVYPSNGWSGLSAGVHTVTVRRISDNTCTNFSTVNLIVSAGAPPTPAVEVVTNPSCSSSKGTLRVVVSGGGTYTPTEFEFSNGGSWTTTNEFEFTAGAGYNITVRRVSDPTCTASTSCEAEQQGAPARYSGNTTDKVHITFPAKEPSVLAYPNPYNDKIRFVVTAPESGQGSLDLFNVLGQKVRNVYQGNIIQGTQTFEVSIPQQQRSTLIYRMILNGRQASGKLINANQ